jgi:hypothetical protein
MSVIYNATCEECGSDIKLADAELDGDLDLHVKFYPCQSCIDSAVDEKDEEISDLENEITSLQARLEDLGQ